MPKNNHDSDINGNFKGKDIISLEQFSATDLELLFSNVPKMKDIATHSKPSDLLCGTITTLLFYEPSSRTFGSFSAAIKRLGGQTVDILDPHHFSSVSKGESLEDTIRVFEAYSDVIVIRHPQKGTASNAATAAKHIPVINAGDGIGEHPTQALLDLYTIYERFNRLSHLRCVIVGDILNGRTVHSLLRGLSKYKNNEVYLLSPKELKLEKNDFNKLSERIKLIEIESEVDIPQDAHVWYWTRVQKERFKNSEDFEKVNNKFILNKKLLNAKGNKDLILMHPLPRVREITTEIDSDERAVYLGSQIRNGMYIRMALLALVLGKIKN